MSRSLKITIHKDRILNVICMLIFLPVMLIRFENYSSFITIIKIVLGCVLLLYVINLKKDDYLAFLWIAYCVVFLISYLLNTSITFKQLLISIYPIGYFLYVYFETKNNPDKMVYSLYDTAIIICTFFLIEFIIQRVVLKNQNPILGDNHNGVPIYMTFVVTAILIKENYFEGGLKFNDVFMLGIAIFAVITSGSATGVIAFALGIVALLMPYTVKTKYELIIYGIIFTSIVILQQTNMFLSRIVLQMFNKNSTFTHRTWRWKFALIHFKNHPIIGNSDLTDEASIFADYDVGIFNPHNALLYIVVFGGILAVIILIVLLLSEGKINYRYFSVFLAITLSNGLMESNMCPDSFVFTTILAVTAGLISFNNKLTQYSQEI